MVNGSEFKGPADFGGDVGAFIQHVGSKPKGYPPLRSLSQRGTSEVKLTQGTGENDELSFALKYGYSQPIALMSNLTMKLYGYMRDGHVTDPLEQLAIKGSNTIMDIIFDARCLNRDGREKEEEERAQYWLRVIETTRAQRKKKKQEARRDVDDDDQVDEPDDDEPDDDEPDDDEPDIEGLIDKWSEAESFMTRARIFEERHGMEPARRYYEKYEAMEQQLQEAEFSAGELPSPYYRYFWCRIRRLQISSERIYDAAMGLPLVDYTGVKQVLADGGNIHDVEPQMPWIFKVAYQQLTGSMMAGDEHRLTITSMIAGRQAQQGGGQWAPPFPQQGGYPYPPPPWAGQNGDAGDEEQKDKRGALISLFGRGGQQQESPETQPLKRRRSRQKA